MDLHPRRIYFPLQRENKTWLFNFRKWISRYEKTKKYDIWPVFISIRNKLNDSSNIYLFRKLYFSSNWVLLRNCEQFPVLVFKRGIYLVAYQGKIWSYYLLYAWSSLLFFERGTEVCRWKNNRYFIPVDVLVEDSNSRLWW